MAKSKVLVISGPMDAKHVGGINVMGGIQPSMLDSYFNRNALQPDELSLHALVAKDNIEVPKRSDTIAGMIRRPSLSIKRSFSKLRRRSTISHASEAHSTNKANAELGQSDSVDTTRSARTLKMQSILSRLRQSVALGRDLSASPPASQRLTPELGGAPTTTRKLDLPLQLRKPISSTYIPRKPSLSQQDTSFAERKTSTIARKPSTMQRKPSPPLHGQAIAQSSRSAQPPSRQKRADSGIAAAFDKVPAQQRPLPFQEIMAVKSFAERMAMYKRMREYWACAEHGLVEWTGKSAGPKFRA
ncbi:hypothetical protein BDU57DRAFT_573564 [Ampelomyces quisqualis]|uniref:Uncharacterized protein n=1 Tax=Ampelomyces quisqualis TaxID=50730 RepID=A0A6A5QJW4_AMPQU|nr:hypothetical protein BDU57DRAFT_573564 [Ampelomyces quisqualis]